MYCFSFFFTISSLITITKQELNQRFWKLKSVGNVSIFVLHLPYKLNFEMKQFPEVYKPGKQIEPPGKKYFIFIRPAN